MSGSRYHARPVARLLAPILALSATWPIPAGAGTTACNIPQPCALYTNAQGYGVQGTSAKSAGVAGSATFAATSATTGVAGVSGTDASTNRNAYNAGVLGFSPYGSGGIGKSTYGTGLVGTSLAANGILGQTSGTSAVRHAGVTGADLSSNSGKNVGVLGTVRNGRYGVEGDSGDGAGGGVYGSATNGYGVYGQSASNIGVYGLSNPYIGVFGSTDTGEGLYGIANSGTAVYGYSSSGIAGSLYSAGSGTAVYATSGTGYGVIAQTGGSVAMYASNSGGNATDVRGSYIGLLGRSNSFPFVATNSSGGNLAYVDGSGNFYAHSYNTFAPLANGHMMTAYATKSTTANVEDVGSSQLVAGAATVSLDPVFAASLDGGDVYQVFLTPGGDSRGLYVASKTRTGFVVRESQGGRATLAFDYRIVGRALGEAHVRMALVAPQSSHMPDAKLVTPPTHRAPDAPIKVRADLR